MARALSEAVERSSRRPHVGLAFAAKLELTAPSALTLWFSDRYMNVVIDGEAVECLPYVHSFAALEASMGVVTVDGTPARSAITFNDETPLTWLGKPRLSALIRTPFNTQGTYEFLFAKLTVFMLLDGLVARREVFFLEESTVEKAKPESTDEVGQLAQLTFTMSDLSLAIENRPQLYLIEGGALRDAAPSALGKYAPAPFGPIAALPLLLIRGGAASKLTAPLATTDGAGKPILLVDPEKYADSGQYLVQVREEVILCDGKISGAPNISKRAQNGTKLPLDAYPAGAGCYELRQGADAYKWLVGENPALARYLMRRAFNVQAQSGLLNGLQINMDDRTVDPKHSLVTVTLPGVPKLLNLTPPPTPGTTPFTTTLKTTTPGVAGANNYGGAESVFTVGVVARMPPPPVGTIKGVRWRLTLSVIWTANQRTWSIGANGQRLNGSPAIPSSGTFTFEFPTGSYGDLTVTAGAQVTTADVAQGLNTGGARITIVACEATVSGESRTGTTPAPSTTEDTSAQSTAEAIWGQLTADVEGLQDDVDGTVSGATRRWLTNPADVSKLILLAVYPGTTAAGFGATWPITRAALQAAGITWGAVIDCAIPFSQLRRKLGEQALAVLHLEEGLWEFPVLLHDPEPGITFQATRVDIGTIARTPRTDLVTRLKVLSAPDLRKGTGTDRYTRVRTPSITAAALAALGLSQHIQQDLELDFINDAAVADAIGAHQLAHLSRQRTTVEMLARWGGVAVDKFDPVAITGDPTLDTWGGGLYVFRPFGRRYLVDGENPGQIVFSLVEANG